jgi:hypothetical protein
MPNLSVNGSGFDLSSDWPETPPPNPERLQASYAYLESIGYDMANSLEDVLYRLVVEHAQVRQANKDLYTAMSNEVARYKARWKMERELAQDALDSVDLLEEELETACICAEANFDAYARAEDERDNAVAALEELGPFINWDGIFNG